MTASPQKVPLPRGVIVIIVALYLGAAVLGAAAALPDKDLLGTPRAALLTGALAVVVLATGLFMRRRWAWFASQAFVVVNGYYLLLGLFSGDVRQLLGLVILAAMATYLATAKVRAAFGVRRT